jgi:hypothetical protein
MPYKDDFLNALEGLGKSVQQYGLSQAINQANAQVQRVKAELQPGVEQRQAISNVAQDVFLRLQAGGADPQSAALVYQNLLPKTPNSLEAALFSDDPSVKQAALEIQNEQELRKARFEDQRFENQMRLTDKLEAGRDRRAEAASDRQANKAARVPTSANATAATYAADLIQANRNFEAINKGTSGSSTVSNLQGHLPGWMQSSSFEKVRQSQNQFIDAIVRKRTGATAKPEELENYRSTYFPTGGESTSVISQKQQVRQQLIQSMLLEAGPAAEQAAAIAGGPTALGMRGVDLSAGELPSFHVPLNKYETKKPRRP